MMCIFLKYYSLHQSTQNMFSAHWAAGILLKPGCQTSDMKAMWTIQFEGLRIGRELAIADSALL